jgi:predicted NBD/HSP70 family sugar kinase
MLVSGRVLSEVARQVGGSGRSPFLAARLSGGRPLHAGDLQDAADAGDEAAIAALERAAATFAAGLRTIVATVDPARILLAGALLAEDAAFGRMVRLRWEAARPFWCRIPLIHVPDDVDAALRGAASFAASFGSNIRPANGREM